MADAECKAAVGGYLAPEIAEANCEADTSTNDCESRTMADASTVQMPGTMTYSRLRDDASISAPAGAGHGHPGNAADAHHAADQPVVPPWAMR